MNKIEDILWDLSHGNTSVTIAAEDIDEIYKEYAVRFTNSLCDYEVPKDAIYDTWGEDTYLIDI